MHATPLSTDGFAIKISPNIGSMGGLSQSLLNAMTLVAEDRPTISITNASQSFEYHRVFDLDGPTAPTPLVR